LVIDSYRKAFFSHSRKLVASARAGNVLGGGDFGKDRLVPDCIRALIGKREIEIRNPESTRPWQFVLEPLSGYLLLGEGLLKGKKELAEAWNFGPEQSSIVAVRKVVELVIRHYGSGKMRHVRVEDKKHEARLLSLSIDKAKRRLGWYPKYDLEQTIKSTVEWYKKSQILGQPGLLAYSYKQIEEYEKSSRKKR